jgi:hypothetical protein
MNQKREDEPNAGSIEDAGDGTTFKREGPEPSRNDSGETVEEMNRAAEDALLRNVTPDEAID